MNLSTAQIATLKAAILAETNPAFVALRTAGATGQMADFYNVDSAFVVWRTLTPVEDVMNAINWANFTPVDTPDGTQLWENRALACQGKQFNLQTLISGRLNIASSRTNIRQGLQDALTNLPSGVGGATLGGNFPAVQTAMQRFAKRGEQVFATGTGTAGSPGTMVVEGNMTDANIVQAVNS